jgi:hypothetical protein
MDSDTVYPFPQAPRRRIFPGTVIDKCKIQTLKREDVVFEAHEVQRSGVAVAAIAYVEFCAGGSVSFEKLTRGSAALEVLRNSVNFGDHKQAAVTRAAAIGTRVPAYRLCYDSVTIAVDLLESLL